MSSDQADSCGSSSQNKRSEKIMPRPMKYIELALKAVEVGMSITVASSTFSVPRDDHIKGKVDYSTNSWTWYSSVI